MTRREYVISALQHKETDLLPYNIDFTHQSYDNMLKYTKDPDFEEKMGCYLHCIHYGGWPTEIEGRPGYFRDDYGVVWNRNGADKDIGVIADVVMEEPDIDAIPDFYLNEERLRKEIEETLKTKEDKFVYAGIGFSLFERYWSLCGMEDALAYMISDPEFTHALLDKICTFNLRIIDIFNEYPFDAIYFGDDWGQQIGLIMGPNNWRKFIKPHIAKMYARVKAAGKFVLQHSCGDINDILGDLVEIGLDCYQTFQPEIYDIVEVKKKYGDKLSFWGGISTQQLLPFATPQKVKEETRRIINILKRGGGYIAAPTHALPFDVPCENIQAMFEVFQEYGR